MKKNWLSYFIAYAVWVIFIGLGFIILIVGRNSFTGLLTKYYAQGKFQPTMEVQFLDKVFLLVVAFALLIFMIVVEEYFRNGAQLSRLTGRILRVMGIELLFVFAAHLAYAFLTLFSVGTMVMLGVELTAALLMTWFGFKRQAKHTIPRTISGIQI